MKLKEEQVKWSLLVQIYVPTRLASLTTTVRNSEDKQTMNNTLSSLNIRKEGRPTLLSWDTMVSCFTGCYKMHHSLLYWSDNCTFPFYYLLHSFLSSAQHNEWVTHAGYHSGNRPPWHEVTSDKIFPITHGSPHPSFSDGLKQSSADVITIPPRFGQIYTHGKAYVDTIRTAL
jgi:hypothetical protein